MRRVYIYSVGKPQNPQYNSSERYNFNKIGDDFLNGRFHKLVSYKQTYNFCSYVNKENLIYRVSQKNGNRTLACYRPFNI